MGMPEQPDTKAANARQKLLKLVAFLQDHGFESDSPALRQQVAALFEADGIEFQDLERVASDLLRQTPEISGLGVRLADGVQLRPADLQQLDEPLLHLALRRTFLRDVELERLLSGVRAQCLAWANSQPDALACHLRFLASLACQCFNNEYVYAVSGDETAQLSRLLDGLVSLDAKAASKADLARLVTAAMYRALDELDCRDASLAPAGRDPDLDDVIMLQLTNPRDERRLIAAIPAFGSIVDHVSRKVRDQYEAYPYPRWLSLKLGEQTPLADWIGHFLPQVSWQGLSQPDVLIAGCGTGKHPLRVAYRHPEAEVLAIDISKTSLGYAKRQADKFRIENVHFAHGDLLSIGELGQSFDYIESIGVLHHMADMAAGIAALVSVLRPGGIAYISVYSRRRLQHLNRAKVVYQDAMGDQRSPDRFRAARQAIADMPEVTELPEFYYLSGLPDIFSPIHADFFSPADVAGLIAGLDVELVGFDGMEAGKEAQYLASYPNDPNRSDAQAIDRFEEQEPGTFNALMGFWLQKHL